MVSGGDLICLQLAHMVVALGLNFAFWAGTNTVAFSNDSILHSIKVNKTKLCSTTKPLGKKQAIAPFSIEDAGPDISG